MSKKLALVAGVKKGDIYVEPKYKVGESIDTVSVGSESFVPFVGLEPGETVGENQFYACYLDDDDRLLGDLAGIPAFVTEKAKETPKDVTVETDDKGGASAKAK